VAAKILLGYHIPEEEREQMADNHQSTPGDNDADTAREGSGNQQLTLHFVHPTDSTQVLTATVGSTSTPTYLISELIKSAFVPNTAAGATYKLVDTANGRELTDHVSLAEAMVASGTTLNVLHSVTGA
jgi:hypothetical protein